MMLARRHGGGVAGLVLLAACAEGRGSSTIEVRGAVVVSESSVPFASAPDFPARVESTVEAALGYWGGSWSALAGKRIVLDRDPFVACGGAPAAVGCYDGEELRVSTRDARFTFRCLEETALVHEIGHAVIGDPGHADPRWMDFGSLARELDGRTGYDAERRVPCPIFINVWRQPHSEPGA